MTSGRDERDGLRARVAELWSFRGRYRVLHLSWFAFFLTFVVWFNLAPFATTIGASLGLSRDQLAVLALCNVALTVPARVLIGMAVDRWGPRRVFAGLLISAAVPTVAFALARSFGVLVATRLVLSVVGGGFVVGIRMVSGWFPPRETGFAEGVYGGWGNAGSAAAALTLPGLAALMGGPDGWRWATAVTGVTAMVYGLFYLRAVSDTPPGRTYTRPAREGALEVTSRPAVVGLLVLTVPLVGVLGLLAWKLAHIGFLPPAAFWGLVVALAVVLTLQGRQVMRVNRPALRDAYDPGERYPFRSVAVLCLAYLVTFGSELAVVSMLPTFFGDTFGLSTVGAGAAASAFAFTNLVARPSGGLLSDLLASRRRTLLGLLAVVTVGYAGMTLIGPVWPVGVAIVVTAACSFFVQAGQGATYAIVPLVARRVSGQIAGLVGAYGTVGAVAYLTLLTVTGPRVFFVVIAASALVAAVTCRWLPEPRGSFAAEHTADAAVVAQAA